MRKFLRWPPKLFEQVFCAIKMEPIWRGWTLQWRGLKALVVRDMMMRYGREHLGFVWVVLEPMLLTAGVLVLWTSLKGAFEHGVRIVELILTGYMLLTLWRHLTNTPIQLFRRNAPLLYHRRVMALDLFYSRIVLEFAATTTALLVVLTVLILLGIVSTVADWTLAVSGWLMMLALGTGAGSLILAGTERNEVLEKFIQPVQYILVPLSGSFYMVGWFPERMRELLLINPLIHCYEMFRSGFFGPGTETFYSVTYVGGWAFALNFLGLCSMHRVQKNIQIV